jgi:carbonic anhydrase
MGGGTAVPLIPIAKQENMNRLLLISEPDNILPIYRGTPIGLLLEYHNLGRTLDPHTKA